MFRRSLLILLGFCLLALALVVGYAFVGLSNPRTALREARDALATRQPDRALRLLSQVEHSLGAGGDPALQAQILTLRYQANLAMQNYQHALVDLERLFQDRPVLDLKLGSELIRTAILADRPEDGLKHALRILRDFPDDGRTLELAGEACQKVYRVGLREFFAELEPTLPPARFAEARDSLLPHLYRNDRDVHSVQGRARFDEIIAQFDPPAATSGIYDARIQELRSLIAQSQRYYRRALEQPGTPVSAYLGLAFALEQGRRSDDSIALAECYVRRFDHVYTIDAAIDLVEAHAAAKRHDAVIEAVDRYLPPGAWQERLAQRSITPKIERLYLLKARALYALRDHDRLVALNTELDELLQATQWEFATTKAFALAYQLDLEERIWQLIDALRVIQSAPEFRQATSGEKAEQFAEVMRMRLGAMRRITDENRDEQISNVLKQWVDARPNDLEPRILRAQFLIESGSPAKAAHDASRAVAVATARQGSPKVAGEPDLDENLTELALRLHARTADLIASGNGRGSVALLRLCLRHRTSSPRRVDDPVLMLPLAQLALNEQHAWIAEACAASAARTYPWARWPYHLWAQALLRAGKADEAISRLEALLEQHPDDRLGLTLLRRARRDAGLPATDLMYDVALAERPDDELALFLVGRCLARKDWAAAQAFAAHIEPDPGKPPRVPLMLAAALRAAGDRQAAADVLRPWLPFLSRVPQVIAGQMVEMYIDLIGPDATLGEIVPFVAAAAELLANDSAALIRVASSLDESGHHAPAYELVNRVLEQPQHKAARTGLFFKLAARVAIALGRIDEAKEHLTAAMAKAGNTSASKWLAMIKVREGLLDDARSIYGEDEAVDVHGAALAVLLGRPEVAQPWITSTLATDLMSVPANCLAFLSDAKLTPPGPYAEVLNGAPELLLETLMFFGLAGFESDARERASALLDRFPANPVTSYLYGRVLEAAGEDQKALGLMIAAAQTEGFLPAFEGIVSIFSKVSPGRLRDPGLQNRIAELVRRHGKATPPGLRVAVLMWLADRLSRQADPESQDIDLLVQLWSDYPEETQANQDSVATLIRFGRWQDAVDLAEILLRRATDDDRSDAAAVFGSTARAAIARSGDVELRERVLASSRDLIERFGHFGPLVHLDLDLLYGAAGSRERIPPEELAAEREYLYGHLAEFEAGRDREVAALELTLMRLMSIDGVAEALRQSEAVLRRDPSLLGVWVVRAQLLEVAGKPDDALASLRWLFDYVDAPRVLLEYSRIAGQAGMVTRADQERLWHELDAAWVDRPDTQLVRGLLSLRMANYPEAVEALERAARRPDGGHLYYLALAHLAIPGAEHGQRAAELLRQFEREYPLSQLSEIADNIAAQLELPEPPQ